MTPGELLTEGYERVYDEMQEGDMIRSLVGGIFPAGDKWIGARLEEMGMAASAVEIRQQTAARDSASRCKLASLPLAPGRIAQTHHLLTPR